MSHNKLKYLCLNKECVADVVVIFDLGLSPEFCPYCGQKSITQMDGFSEDEGRNLKKLYENDELEVWVDPQELEDKVLYNTEILDIQELVEEFKDWNLKDVKPELDYYRSCGVKVIIKSKT